jgi:excisionase family DNA binding protein
MSAGDKPVPIDEQQTVDLLKMLLAKVDALQAVSQLPEFYSIKRAAKVVDVSGDHIRRAVVGGVLAASNVGTMARPTYRIARTDLLAWVDKGKAGAIAPADRKKAVIPLSRHHQLRRQDGHSPERGS